jgi:hypothetical protein
MTGAAALLHVDTDTAALKPIVRTGSGLLVQGAPDGVFWIPWKPGCDLPGDGAALE